jgi:hypothetical protein
MLRRHLEKLARLLWICAGVQGSGPTSPEFFPASPDLRRLLEKLARLPWIYADIQGSGLTSPEFFLASPDLGRLPEKLARLPWTCAGIQGSGPTSPEIQDAMGRSTLRIVKIPTLHVFHARIRKTT